MICINHIFFCIYICLNIRRNICHCPSVKFLDNLNCHSLFIDTLVVAQLLRLREEQLTNSFDPKYLHKHYIDLFVFDILIVVLNYSVACSERERNIYLDRKEKRLCHIIIITKDVNRMLASRSITDHLFVITVDNGQ